MWTHWGLNWFFLPNPIFVICLNFQQKNPLRKQYLPHLSSENCEIKSIEFDSPRAFQKHQECPPILIHLSISILSGFHWENGSISNSFHIVAPNSLKPSQCTSLFKSIPKIPGVWHEPHGLGPLRGWLLKSNIFGHNFHLLSWRCMLANLQKKKWSAGGCREPALYFFI